MPAINLHSDQQLLSLLKQGNQDAFTKLYHLYSERLYLNLRQMLKSGPLAEELLQEIFVLLWEKRETITVHTSFRAYLQRVAENKVIDYFRKARRNQKLYTQLKATDPEQYLYPEEYLYSNEQARLLAEALETLPPQRKLVFVSCKLQGKSYYEVSELLGISASTINDHIVKATRIIRQFMLTHREITIFLIPVTVGSLLYFLIH